ncbi:hypothetical protein ACTXT7_004138 [Hymenolepis weldensis]
MMLEKSNLADIPDEENRKLRYAIHRRTILALQFNEVASTYFVPDLRGKIPESGKSKRTGSTKMEGNNTKKDEICNPRQSY